MPNLAQRLDVKSAGLIMMKIGTWTRIALTSAVYFLRFVAFNIAFCM